MPASALPDWDRPIEIAGRTLYAALDRPRLFFAPPLRLAAAAGDAREALTLDVVSSDRPGGLDTTGFLAIRLESEHDLDAARRAAFGDDPAVRVEPLPASGGVLRLEAPDAVALSDLALPLDAAGVSGLLATARLTSEGSDLLAGALAAGTTLVTARALVEVRGCAARWAGTADVDVERLVAALGSPAVLRTADLVDALEREPAALGIVVSAPADDDAGRRRLAAALSDRLTGLLGPGDLVDGEACLRLGESSGTLPDRVHWALEDRVTTPRHLVLAADPWGPLRTLSPADVAARVVRHHVVPALDSGSRTLGVACVVTPPWAGAAAITADVTVPASPPERTTTIRETLVLDPAAPFTTLALRLAPGEELRAQVRTLVFLDAPVPELAGPELEVRAPSVVLRADDFGVDLLPVELDAALRAQAVAVDVVHEADLAGLAVRTRVTLDARTPRATLVLPPGTTGGRLRAEARDAVGRVATTPDLPAGPTRLDPFSFDGAGAHTVEVVADPPPVGPEVVRLELAGEDDDDVTSLALTAARPRATFSYLATSPFAAGYRWRRAGEATFSDPLAPGASLRVPLPVGGGAP